MAGQSPIASSLLAVRPGVASTSRPLSGDTEPATPFTLPVGSSASPLGDGGKSVLPVSEPAQELTLLVDELLADQLLESGVGEVLPQTLTDDLEQAGLASLVEEESVEEYPLLAGSGAPITETETTGQTPGESGKSLPFAAQSSPAVANPTGDMAKGHSDPMAESARRVNAEPLSAAAGLDGELTAEQDAERFLNPTGQSPLGKLMSVKGTAGSVTLEKTDGAQPLPVNPAETLSTERLRAPAERGFTVQSEVRVPVGQQPQWHQAVGERVLWLASQKVGVAEIRLDPPDLGPLQVRISVQQEQVSVTFTSAHLGVREALDQSATRLRELFSEQGLDLVNVDISDQPQGYDSQAQADGQGGHAGDAEGDSADQEPRQVQSLRLVDHYV